MIFFRANETTGALDVADMRMNGSCAGGTGAFIDEIASVLNLPIEQFDAAACRGRTVYDISGRCGVYAKTDIQPLLNQGASRDDLALSAFHAIAKQTLGGLAQGIDVCPPIIFEGGPLTFNPALISVFKGATQPQRRPGHRPRAPRNHGRPRRRAIAFRHVRRHARNHRSRRSCSKRSPASPAPTTTTLPASPSSKPPPSVRLSSGATSCPRNRTAPKAPPRNPVRNGRLRVWIGIDSGSTTTKLALVADDDQLIDSFYANNEGDPLEVARRALVSLRDRYAAAGVTLDIAGVGTTGYGELLFNRALHADYHTVETVAHAHAATRYEPHASFILDIGGQDMKAIWLSDGIIGNIVVNEACSSGCGSFLENFAQTLGVPTPEIADAAFTSEQPAVLGSRCTVFMNSSIVSEQRKRPHTCGYHGRPMPLDHRERVHESRARSQPRQPRRAYRGARRHVSQRRGTLRPRAAHRPPCHACALPRAHGRYRRRAAHARPHSKTSMRTGKMRRRRSRVPHTRPRRRAKPGPCAQHLHRP